MAKRFVSFLALLWVAGIGIQSLIGPTPAHAQQRVQLTNPETEERVARTYPEGADVLFPITPDPSTGWPHQKAAVINPQDTAQVIVEFKQKSVVRRRAQLRKRGVPSKALGSRLEAHRTQLEGLLDRFRRDLREMARGESEGAPRKAAPMGQETRITWEYTEVFSGTAVTTREWAVGQIRKLSYVEDTYPDREVEAVVGDARKVVDAEALQAAQGATGEGVEIGIIDTGIDYTHPALGGGFGSDNKVVGGYDFVNEDDDPMDDNGHGTHVAGISAANGDSITGIAPQARLRGYKVLNREGRGRSSDIIAAIERAVDDGVDVINMSLGGGGTPDDPLSQATDNASREGVLPVVSAGNAGPGYQTIGSPGTARRALTVGASNDSDQIADFSSRGPTDGAFTVKPDVVAPGVDIRSTLPNGDYGKLSGTSMSAPVTAGVAALLLDLHPGWSPTFTKGALMKTGVDIGEDLWTQGRGRVDADDAAEADVVATPGILSFGLVDNGQDTWTHTDTLTFRNRGNSSRTYNLSTGPSPASGVSVNLSASSVTVAGGDSAHVPVTAVVNNDVAPFPEEDAPAFTGQVTASASQDTMTVPYGIVKAPTITFSFGEHEEYVLLWVHRPDGDIVLFRNYNEPPEKTIVLPQVGTYNFIALLDGTPSGNDAVLVKEDIPVPDNSSLALGPAEAEHTVTLNLRDEAGDSLPLDEFGSFTILHDSGIFLKTGALSNTTQFSSVSDEYTFQGLSTSHVFENGRSKDYRFPFYFSSVSGNRTFSNDAGHLRKTTYRLGEEITSRALFSNVTHVDLGGLAIASWKYSCTRTPVSEIETPVTRELYVLPKPAEGHSTYPSYRIYDCAGAGEGSFDPPSLFETGSPQIEGPDTTVFSRYTNFSTGLRRGVEDLGTIDIGGHPPRWAARAVPGDTLHSGLDLDTGWFEGPFAGVRLGSVVYERYDGETLVEEDSLLNSAHDPHRGRSLQDFGTGDSLVARFEHPMAGRSGAVELRFVPGTGDLRPRFEDFQILSGGQVTDTLASPRENGLRASLKAGSVDSMVAYTRPTDGSEWTQISSAQSGGSLNAEVPRHATGHYAVRVVARGTGGGRVEQVADPAFWYRLEGPLASANKYVGEDGSVDFADTGLSLNFFGVSNADSITVEKHDEAPSEPDEIAEQNVSHYRFVIEAGNALTFDSSKVQLAVSDLSGIDDPSNVRIYHRDEPGTGAFSALETTVDDNGTPGDISDDTLSAWTDRFSEFALASDTEPLPVELAAFEATVDEGRARLTWRTASETQNAGFAVQRRVASTPGERRAEPQGEWQKIGFVESKAQGGSTTDPISYQFTDTDLPYAADSLTYRLRQIDTDGSTRLSDEITLRRTVDEVQLLNTYPNPARQNATLRYAVPDRQNVEIRLYDVLGRRVKTVVDGEREGRQETQLDVSRLASGVYFLRLQAEGATKTRRLTVVR